ncbi:MAG TPA: sugar transferase, partial [Nitrospinaceae bacterium]|nr:sugar transferase [Nitrospinaceae bacterium]
MLDLTFVFLTSPIWLPVIGLIWLLARIKLGSPVWFCQTRPGFKGKPFTVIKFRTMTDAMHEKGNPLPDADRLTAFGKWLRSTSLDELPELIIKGEMSLVGPRPLLVDYMPLYSERQAKRHNVLPG